MIELKPCPFCGKNVELVIDAEYEIAYGVKCFYCNGFMDTVYDSKSKAIKAWNRRVKEGEQE